MTVAETVHQKITSALKPAMLKVEDESYKHAGHAGAKPEGETHFNLEIVADAFAGKSRVQRQQLVYKILAEEMAGPIHALSMSTKAPGE
ncbi:MAG: BolA family transcriptional regulator [Alphaproteobacteria bacterium]|nr:BolA family transcriptional regulator [Rhodospirillales bacterium]MCW9045253.1 BolA family transcriptional regulator [Alphaproteobacteria bacterium]